MTMNTQQEKVAGQRTGMSKAIRNVLVFVLCVVGAFLLTLLVGGSDFTVSQNYVLFLLFFSIGLWLTEAVPPFAVGLFIMAFLYFALGKSHFNPQPVDVAKYVQTFSNSVIWLLLGGFFLAEAMTKTGIDEYLFRLSLRMSGKIPGNILLGTMGMTMVASLILSNSATTSMVIASVMPLVKKLGKSNFANALLVGIPIAATIGGMGTIIASPVNAIAVSALQYQGISMTFTRWMLFGIPLSLVLTLATWWVLKRIYIRSQDPIEIDFNATKKANEKVPVGQRRIVVIVLVLTVALWLTSPLHLFSVSAVAAFPLIFLTMSGILKAEDIRKIPWDTLLLVAGGLSLGLALEDTKLLEHFAGLIMSSSLSTFVMFLIFAYLTMLLSNIMSNTATSSILIPLAIHMVPAHKEQIAVIIALASSTALLLPVSTPPNAIAYGTGLIRQKDFLPGGLLVGLLGPFLIILVVMAMV
jgi:sodium-dependent dicarboxylate transporter 2/3/5